MLNTSNVVNYANNMNYPSPFNFKNLILNRIKIILGNQQTYFKQVKLILTERKSDTVEGSAEDTPYIIYNI